MDPGPSVLDADLTTVMYALISFILECCTVLYVRALEDYSDYSYYRMQLLTYLVTLIAERISPWSSALASSLLLAAI